MVLSQLAALESSFVHMHVFSNVHVHVHVWWWYTEKIEVCPCVGARHCKPVCQCEQQATVFGLTCTPFSSTLPCWEAGHFLWLGSWLHMLVCELLHLPHLVWWIILQFVLSLGAVRLGGYECGNLVWALKVSNKLWSSFFFFSENVNQPWLVSTTGRTLLFLDFFAFSFW